MNRSEFFYFILKLYSQTSKDKFQIGRLDIFQSDNFLLNFKKFDLKYSGSSSSSNFIEIVQHRRDLNPRSPARRADVLPTKPEIS